MAFEMWRKDKSIYCTLAFIYKIIIIDYMNKEV